MLGGPEERSQRLCAPLSPAQVELLVKGAGFDPLAYRDAHSDLRASGMDDVAALRHFLTDGFMRRRYFPLRLDLAGLTRLAEMPLANARYRRALISALADAFLQNLAPRMDEEITNIWPVLIALLRLGAEPVFVIGDSHSHLCCRRTFRKDRWLIPVQLLCSGASAIGLPNPKSRVQFGPRIRFLLETLEHLGWEPHSPMLFKFGQVDTEFVYTFRRIERGFESFNWQDFKTFCERSVDSYIGFLLNLPKSLLSGFVVCSVFPPSLSDTRWAEGYVNGHIAVLNSPVALPELRQAVRTLEIPDIFQRTMMHRHYNELLEQKATSVGLRYADHFECFLDGTGIVDRAYVGNSNGGDHHLEWPPCGPLMATHLWRAVDKLHASG